MDYLLLINLNKDNGMISDTFYYFLDDLENRRVRRGTQRKITTLCVPPRPLRLIFFAMTH
jgi:hypothetical protein